VSVGFGERVVRYVKRNAASALFQKRIAVRPTKPLISFTFDDYPRSALLCGGAILKRHHVSGTYYVALGLMGQDSPSGPICVLDDLKRTLDDGHELGSHTYSHCHSWDTPPSEFEDSVVKNGSALSEMLPGTVFRSFSYPICAPRPTIKKHTSRHFDCCRAEGQILNAGVADLNQLSAFFLERSRDNIAEVKKLIDKNAEERGWIIFATHDIESRPSPYGCTPEFFAEVVRYGVESGAQILPVIEALAVLQRETAPGHAPVLKHARN